MKDQPPMHSHNVPDTTAIKDQIQTINYATLVEKKIDSRQTLSETIAENTPIKSCQYTLKEIIG